jgi:hypothetical protein
MDQRDERWHSSVCHQAVAGCRRKHTEAMRDNEGLDCLPFRRSGEGDYIREHNTNVPREGRV